MTDILLIVSIVLLLIAIVLIWFRNSQSPALALLQTQVASVQTALDKLETGLKEDFRINRVESADLAKANRQELNETLHGFKAEQSQTLTTITTHNRQALIDINQTLDDKVKSLTTTVDTNNNLNRDSLLTAFKTFQDNFDAHIKTFNEVQRDKFAQMLNSQQTLISNTETKLENIRTTVEEKLEKTLSERLGQSFETVGKQLIEVQKGLGEMQTIATDVGGLKKVLSNVKLRGGVGEVQLALLLEQILAPSQYEANVKTKKGSSEPVEFAIKLPGRSDDENAFVYLPIDAKFPKDTYEHLLTAYETANPDDIEAASKNLETTIKKMAKDIRDKYLDPPHTTDFAILFLPFESIYAEVIRRSALIDQLRTEFKITVAGSTTLMAILNSLQMGFRTLALQKRSSEVWQVLATVKKEFENFGGLLEKAQKNIHTGLGQLDDVVGTRTRAINRQLKQVESLPVVNARVEIPTIDIPTTKDELDE
jgi:DNA recombination protein RmuC